MKDEVEALRPSLHPSSFRLHPYFISTPHERQCVRRFALSVPQDVQRLYIVRANQLVMRALTTRMPASRRRLRSVSFNPSASRTARCGSAARARTRA